MSSPDHRPYLRDTDLRTAEDVLEWLGSRRAALPERSVCREWEAVDNAACDLEARLDRERRQACRRGALESWRHLARFLRRNKVPFLTRGDELPASVGVLTVMRFGSHSPDGYPWESANEVYGWLYRAFARSLAFRAAARAR